MARHAVSNVGPKSKVRMFGGLFRPDKQDHQNKLRTKDGTYTGAVVQPGLRNRSSKPSSYITGSCGAFKPRRDRVKIDPEHPDGIP